MSIRHNSLFSNRPMYIFITTCYLANVAIEIATSKEKTIASNLFPVDNIKLIFFSVAETTLRSIDSFTHTHTQTRRLFLLELVLDSSSTWHWIYLTYVFEQKLQHHENLCNIPLNNNPQRSDSVGADQESSHENKKALSPFYHKKYFW